MMEVTFLAPIKRCMAVEICICDLSRRRPLTISVVVSASGEMFGPMPRDGTVTRTRSPSRRIGRYSKCGLISSITSVISAKSCSAKRFEMPSNSIFIPELNPSLIRSPSSCRELYLKRTKLWILIFLFVEVDLKSNPFSTLPMTYSCFSCTVKILLS
jgi:hypothetical protein